MTQSGRAALPWIVGDVRYWPKADTPHYSIRPRFWLHGTSPKYLSNLARCFPANVITLAFKLGDCVIFYYREFFQQLFARSGAVLSHIELTSKCQEPNHYQFTRWYALRQINNFRDLVVSPGPRVDPPPWCKARTTAISPQSDRGNAHLVNTGVR
jgi:hypothetical protein